MAVKYDPILGDLRESDEGTPGQGVAAGGTTGQTLVKASNADYDTEWGDAGSGDMTAAVYDPQAIAADAFDTDNHTDGTTNKVYTAVEKTKLAGIEASADVTDTANVTAAGALMDSEVTNLAQVKAFDETDYATAAQGALADSAVQDLADLSITATASELNTLDGITATTAELNYTDGVTSAIQTQLDGKVDENAAITGATKTKITYDAKGLVTAGADATTADIADSSNKRYVTDAQLTVIGNTSGTNTGDQDLSSYATKTGVETLTNKTLTSPVINTPTGIVKGDVGLGNVDNTSDATKNAASVTLTNKTIDGDDNTIQDLGDGVFKSTADVLKGMLGLHINGGGSAITTGLKGYIHIPYNCVPTKWVLLGVTAGSVTIDIYKDTYANYPPTVADTIINTGAGGVKPSIAASGVKAESTSFANWTTTFSQGDVLGINVDAVSGLTELQVILEVRKT